MDENQMLTFLRSLANIDRLRMVGFLAHGSARFSDIIAALGFSSSAACRHLAQLLRAGVVRQVGDYYELDGAVLEGLARTQLQGTRRDWLPQPDLEDDRRRVLSAHLNPDGSVKTIPLQPAKRHILLEYLLDAFTLGVTYSGKDVNRLLARFHPDTAALRRYLVDAGMLERKRDGSQYWRPQ